MHATYRFGIEEEFFLADAVTRGSARRSLAGFHRDARKRLPNAERELMESQVEISSPPLTCFAEARSVLSGLRSELAEVGRAHRILMFAAGTHPLARWPDQRRTRKQRYAELTRQMQMVARRNFVCGMHVHVEVPDPEQRVDLMNRLMPYMPLLLALSASSPFWQGRPTGLQAYRMSVWGEMPRTGLPDLFQTDADYRHYVDTMVQAGVIDDASFLWWTLRPSVRYPTLELRVADSCTLLSHTLAIAALYRCLVRHAVQHPALNRNLTGASRAIVSENLWRAQRAGVRAQFIDETTRSLQTATDALAYVIAMVEPDADALGCIQELRAAQDIVRTGGSSGQQIARFESAYERTPNERIALRDVVDWLALTTAGQGTSCKCDHAPD
jgi:glutamate---cysteine ligase / carboxylate-amine ligase